MIVLDSSAIVALFLQEPEGEFFSERMLAANRLVLSVANYLECVIVLSARGIPREALDEWIEQSHIELVSVTRHQINLAVKAYEAYGRGTGHAARLNYGDCFAYALAREQDAPLLYKGDDFSLTDLRRA